MIKTIVLELLQQGHIDEEAFLQELDEADRTAIGTPELWSVKDHLAHMTFWHQDLIQKVTAILQHQEVPPNEKSDEQINAHVFAENHLRPWPEIRADSERVRADLIRLVECLGEDELTDAHRFVAITGGWPLYAAFLGNCYEHDQEHLVQYYSDRNDLSRAIQIREGCANRIMQADLPDKVKGSFLYNLACFYAQFERPEEAATRLKEAVALAPRLAEIAQRDPALALLRDVSA